MPVPSTLRRPGVELRPWLAGLWASAAHPVAETVLPAGCAHLVFGLGPGPVGALLHGPASRAREVEPATGEFVGVRFRAGGTGPFFGSRADELADRSIPLVALWGTTGHEVVARLAACDDTRTRLDLVEAELRRHVAGARVPALLASARGLLRSGTAVEEVAARSGVDRRVLAAMFRREVGFGPKRYARLARFERVLGDLRAPDASGLAALAARHGYADQAHLTREFADLAGLPPGRLHRVPGPTALHVLRDETFKTGGRRSSRLGG